MNLINLFQKAVDIGMKTVESSVFYEAPIGIRFEIGGEDDDENIKKGISRKLFPNPDYVNKAVERASKIFNVLPKKDWILRIDLYDYQEIKKILIRWMRKGRWCLLLWHRLPNKKVSHLVKTLNSGFNIDINKVKCK